jgi:hypothetical protein
MIIPSNIIVNNDTAYLLLDTLPVSKFCESVSADPRMDIVKAYRDWAKADHVLKKNGYFLFCETIKDAEIIEDDSDITEEE